MLRAIAAVFAGVLLCMPARAQQTVALGGILGGKKALLIVDGGKPRALAAGDAAHGVQVLQVGRERVTILVQGQRQTLELGGEPLQLNAAAVPAPASARPRVVLWADAQGHFVERGYINGRSVTFMVDTGASAVAIGRPDAERLGLPFLQQGRPVTMRTANGEVQGWHLRLQSVRLGALEVQNLDAIIAPQPMPYILLGNNFLACCQMTRQGSEMVLERR